MGSFRYYNEETGQFDKLSYTTVAREGNLKVVVLNEGEISSINFFGEDKRKTKQIDLKHKHQGMIPHVHEFHGEKYHPSSARPCNKEELELISRAKELAK